MAQKKVFKISDEQIKQLYLEGNSLNDIAKVAQDTKGLMALRQRLIDLGVDTTKNMKKYSHKISKSGKHYTLNEHIFDCIDSEEKAYWLGWYMTDGYNHQSKSCVAIRLQANDLEILEKLKAFLQTDTPIYTFIRDKRRYVELNICSPYFSESLARWGVVQNKVHHKSIPSIDPSYIKAFLRGYFDGDGCISISDRKDRKEGSKTYQVTFTGNEEPLIFIENILRKELSLTERHLHKCRTSNILHYGGQQVCLKILNWLYKDAIIYLQRKFDKYQSIVSRQSNLQK